MSQGPPNQEPEAEPGGFIPEWKALPVGTGEDPRMKELREVIKEARKDPTLWERAKAIGRAIRDALDPRGEH